ncbi:MmgE/PrpD family protein [Lampropedia puyangensis]|nr:MmgE/PrpD family protein [Lampropedia puyangensis]
MQVIAPRTVPKMPGFDALIDTMVALQCDDLPAGAVTSAKYSLLDTLAVALAGRAAAGMHGVRALALEEGGAAQASLWGEGTAVPVSNAAFYNAAIASALDFDSLSPHVGHMDATIIPAALAAAQWRNCSGAEFLAAFVAGAELGYRLGRATLNTRGWYRVSLYGVFGATVAAGKLAGLTSEQLKSALGLALLQAAGTLQNHTERTLGKRLMAAFAAKAGVQAVRLAMQGITGPAQSLDGKYGLFAMYEEADLSHVAADYGQVFLNQDTTYKKFPTCGCTHAALEAALTVVHRHDIAVDQVAAIDVVLTPYMHQLVGYPFEAGGDVEVIGQFCAQYAVASALVHRRYTPAELTRDVVLSERVAEIVAKTQVRVDPTLTSMHAPAEVRVVLHTGQQYAVRIEQLPDLAAGESGYLALKDKARGCMSAGPQALSHSAQEALIDRIETIETRPEMADFLMHLW